MAQAIFIILSLFILGCALVVVTNRNLFHSALYLVFVFIGVAGLYLMLQAEFFAGIQVLIYVGAILTLIIFAIMLSRDLMNPNVRGFNRQWWAAAIVAGLLFVVLAVVLVRAPWPAAPMGEPSPAFIAELGQALVSPAYVLPFEVVSILLLAALVGSILIARER
ncbi:MAG: NADH-quinone oxidoreductase subunit J [Anaerolineae bacterium]|nr:NADH-quinone oxidoreductase subunit J [Anaerolineae bacterium]